MKLFHYVFGDKLQPQTKLNRLLQELCPEGGVEYKKLGEVCEIERGERVTKKDLLSDGLYNVVSGGIGFLGKINNYNRSEDTITIAQYGSAGYVNWQTERFWANDVCYCAFPHEIINNRFLYHVLLSNQQKLYAMRIEAIPAHLPKEKLLSLQIPVPPLAVQQEIVRILDRFDTLCNDMSRGLPAEIAARQKQYEYYRDKLLTFEALPD